MHEHDIEHLISRSLDGALDEEETLALNRELIRHPEYQRLMDELRELDGLAGDALGAAVPDRAASLDPESWIENLNPQPARRRFSAGWLLLPGSIAAALLAVFVNTLGQSATTSKSANRANFDTPPPVEFRVADGPKQPKDDVMRNASIEPRHRIRHDLSRDVLGISGRDGVMYFIEIDRLRTIKRRNLRADDGTIREQM